MKTKGHGHLDRGLLPVPKIYYTDAIGKLTRPSRGWSRGNCPFHDSKSKTSFSVHLDSGAFYCHGCRAKGGDVVSFIRMRDRVSFVEACKRVGAWVEDGGRKPKRKLPAPLRRFLVMDLTIGGTTYTSDAIEDEPRSWLELVRRIYGEALARLTEIHHGDIERYQGETEDQWNVLSASWELIEREVRRD